MPTTPVAVITGAGSGIGRAAAFTLARAGHNLVLIGRRAEALEETAALLAGSTESISLPADIADPSSARSIVSAALGRFGRLDTVVNNAAMAPLKPIEEHSPALLQQTFFTNTVGPACLISAAWTVFKKQHAEGNLAPLGHCVVNVSTLGTKDPFPGFFAYAASKAGLNLMARSCAKEGAACRVRAFAVAPGAVETPMLRALFTPELLPPSHCLTPERVAEEILACIAGERDHLNGQTIFLTADNAL